MELAKLHHVFGQQFLME